MSAQQDNADPARELRDKIDFMSDEEVAFVNRLAGDVLAGGIAFAKRIAAIQLLANPLGCLKPADIAEIMPILDEAGSIEAGLCDP